MAKKKAVKKVSRKVSTQPDMQTLSTATVLTANAFLARRKKEMEGSAHEIDWDGSLEDLWRALISAYWTYGEKQTKSFLETEIAAIRRFYRKKG